MKKGTIIKTRAYCMNIDVKVRRVHLDLEQCKEWVKRHVIDTASVIEITHIENKKECRKIKNPTYKDPGGFETEIDVEKYKKNEN
jgi:hypothetical protein